MPVSEDLGLGLQLVEARRRRWIPTALDTQPLSRRRPAACPVFQTCPRVTSPTGTGDRASPKNPAPPCRGPGRRWLHRDSAHDVVADAARPRGSGSSARHRPSPGRTWSSPSSALNSSAWLGRELHVDNRAPVTRATRRRRRRWSCPGSQSLFSAPVFAEASASAPADDLADSWVISAWRAWFWRVRVSSVRRRSRWPTSSLAAGPRARTRPTAAAAYTKGCRQRGSNASAPLRRSRLEVVQRPPPPASTGVRTAIDVRVRCPRLPR